MTAVSVREVPASIAQRLTDAADSFAGAYEDLRMDDIARASGIPRATLYYHFAGKDDVLAFLFQALLSELGAEVALAAGDEGRPTRERLTALVRTLLDRLADRPGAAQLLLANLGRAGKLPDMAAGVEAAFYAPFERVLAEGVRTGDVRPCDARVTATAIFGSVSILGLQALVTEGHLDAPRLTALLTDVLWSGVGAHPEPTGARPTTARPRRSRTP